MLNTSCNYSILFSAWARNHQWVLICSITYCNKEIELCTSHILQQCHTCNPSSTPPVFVLVALPRSVTEWTMLLRKGAARWSVRSTRCAEDSLKEAAVGDTCMIYSKCKIVSWQLSNPSARKCDRHRNILGDTLFSSHKNPISLTRMNVFHAFQRVCVAAIRFVMFTTVFIV